MRFCTSCGASLKLARPEGDDRERHVCSGCGLVHYRNPKIVVGAVCRWGDRILLCRRAIEPRAGYWTIPAGYLELGESAEEGARREAWEEARAEIEIDGLLAVYSVPEIGQVQLLFRARLLNPDVSPGIESLDVRLVDWADIPWNDLAFPTVDWVLRRSLETNGTPGPLVPVFNPPGR
jgi:ADP-ribose pyrophosphatase YjhB (NUDIX family)